MRFLELKDVIRLLRSEVERAGGPTAWAKKPALTEPQSAGSLTTCNGQLSQSFWL
jgi:hypothetical protein